MKKAHFESYDRIRQKLREVDDLNVELGDQYFNSLQDRIMARIEKTSIAELEPQGEEYERKKASHGRGRNLISIIL